MTFAFLFASFSDLRLPDGHSITRASRGCCEAKLARNNMQLLKASFWYPSAFLFLVMMIIVVPQLPAQGKAMPEQTRQAQIEEEREGLRSRYPEVRAGSARRLASLAAKQHAREIGNLLRDRDENVVEAAIDALGQLGAKEFSKDIARFVKHRNLQYVAVSALERLDAKKELARLLKARDSSLVLRGAEVLARLEAREYSNEIAQTFVRLAKEKRRKVNLFFDDSAVVLKALATLEGSGAVRVFLKDQDPAVRKSALEATFAFGQDFQPKEIPKEIMSDIALLLKDGDPEVRARAVVALGQLGAREQAKDVALLLNDKAIVSFPITPHPDVHTVRVLAVQALGKLRATEFAPQLIQLLEEEVLPSAGNDPDEFGERLTFHTIQSLGHMGARDHAKDVAPFLEDERRSIRVAALEVLGQLGAREYIEDIRQHLGDPGLYVKPTAVSTLTRLQVKDHPEAVLQLLQHEDPEVRRSVASTLGVLRAKEFARDVAGLLSDGNPWVRADGVQALANLGAREYAKAIALLLKDQAVLSEDEHDFVGSRTVRGFAARALGRLGAKEYADEVAQLLHDEDFSTRHSAADALMWLR